MNSIRLPRRAAAEFLGTALLACILVGSGIAAERLSADPGLRLLENTIACVFGLGVLIMVLGPVSGAHINPLLSFADSVLARNGEGLSRRDLAVYVGAQMLGGLVGVVLANVMFAAPAGLSTAERVAPHAFVGEIVAAAGLVFVFSALARAGQSLAVVAVTMAAYLGAASWFTSSFGLLNPALTVGRIFTDTYAGVGPVSAVLYLAAQLIGAVFGLIATVALLPAASAAMIDDEQPAAAV